MAEYPYYVDIYGRMKGEQKEIEKLVERFSVLSKASQSEDEKGEDIWVVIDDGEEVPLTLSGAETAFLELCWELDIGEERHAKYTLDVYPNGITFKDDEYGFNVEAPWERLYPALSSLIPNVDILFTTQIDDEEEAGTAWHAYKDGECNDSGSRTYEFTCGLMLGKSISETFYAYELTAWRELWNVKDGKDKKIKDEAQEKYDKARQTADLMENIARLGNSAWQEGDKNSLDFESCDFINNNLDFAALLEAVEKRTLVSDVSYVGTGEFPDSLSDITAINLKDCKEVTELPEAIMRCKNLREINLVDSGITEVPEWLKKMDGVQIISNMLYE